MKYKFGYSSADKSCIGLFFFIIVGNMSWIYLIMLFCVVLLTAPFKSQCN